METLRKYFGARIKEIRVSRGLNQEQLAEIVGIESRHLSRIETGKSFTTLENVDKIAKALNVDLSTFFVFQHQKTKRVLIQKINNYFKNASYNQIEMALKIMQALFD